MTICICGWSHRAVHWHSHRLLINLSLQSINASFIILGRITEKTLLPQTKLLLIKHHLLPLYRESLFCNIERYHEQTRKKQHLCKNNWVRQSSAMNFTSFTAPTWNSEQKLVKTQHLTKNTRRKQKKESNLFPLVCCTLVTFTIFLVFYVFTFRCCSKALSASSFSFRNCSSNAIRRFSISSFKSIPIWTFTEKNSDIYFFVTSNHLSESLVI